MRGQFAVQGGLPAKVSTAAWDAASDVDSGPQFSPPSRLIELPTATPVKVLGGSFQAGLAMPLDEQWIVGSYSPDDFDITMRSFAISFLLKITDAHALLEDDLRPGRRLHLGGQPVLARPTSSSRSTPTSRPITGVIRYSLTIAGNGQSGDKRQRDLVRVSRRDARRPPDRAERERGLHRRPRPAFRSPPLW